MDNFDLWVAQRTSTHGPWETAVNLGPVVNTPRNDIGPALSADGHLLFFASDRDGTPGTPDIYVPRPAAPKDDFGGGPPTPPAPQWKPPLPQPGRSSPQS